MKRWLLLSLLVIVLGASFLVFRTYTSTHTHSTASLPVIRLQQLQQLPLVRTPKSAYKYHLCSEAFAFAWATKDNPYKTDYTFHDPFRHADDTIIPRLLNFDQHSNSVTFSMQIIIKQVAIFNELISHVQEQDGISVPIPDAHNRLQLSSVPQFIISLPNGNGGIAILDYTCPEQWVWKAM